MTRKCGIGNCSNSQRNNSVKQKKVSFHFFPSDPALSDAWKNAIKLNTGRDIDGLRPIVCSDHFVDGEIKKLGRQTFLNTLAVPSIFPPNGSYKKQPQLILEQKSTNDSTPVLESKRKTNFAGCVISSVCNAESVIIYNNDIPGNMLQAPHSNVILNSVCYANLDPLKVFDEVQLDSKEGRVPKVNNLLPSVAYSTQNPTIRYPSSAANSTPNPSIRNPTSVVYAMPARTIRYPGDINEEEEMSSDTAKDNLRLCKTKIKEQANQIHRLKQTVKRQKKKIQAMKELNCWRKAFELTELSEIN